MTTSFGVKRLKFKVTVGQKCWKMHFFLFVNVVSWKSLDWISPNFERWYILGQRWMVQFFCD